MPKKSKVEKTKKSGAPKKVNQRELSELDKEARAVEQSEEEGKEEFERENP
ncbi:MAG: hypothetical protein ACRECH_08745 [Nitrososphaerales archaeon]